MSASLNTFDLSAMAASIYAPSGPADFAMRTRTLSLSLDAQEEGGEAPSPLHGRLSFGEVLGTGGTAVVHGGTQRVLGREVAIKGLRSDRDRGNARDNLLREARLTGMLEHPNIIPVHDVLVDDGGQPHIVMRKVTGATWTTLLGDPAQARKLAGHTDLFEWHLGVLLQVCNALDFAHSRGIVHRDLKPDNVMVGAFGEVYLMDWGLAVTTGDDLVGIPRGDAQNQMAGTPAYMAPEMLGEGAPVTTATDVFLLGALLYAALTGQPPYRGPMNDDLRARIRSARPTMPGNAPAELTAICGRAMAARPEDRFPSVDAFRSALQGYLRQRGAEVLVNETMMQLGRLLGLLSSSTRSDSDDRLAIYHLFGQCRFGFEQALRINPDRGDARNGRATAIAAMVEFELDRDDADAAAVLLTGLDTAPSELLSRLQAVRASGSPYGEKRTPESLQLLLIGALATLLPLWGVFLDRWVQGMPYATVLIVAITLLNGVVAKGVYGVLKERGSG